MLTDLNQMYLYGWSSTGSSKKIVKECINIVINTLLHVLNFRNHLFYSENILFYRFLARLDRVQEELLYYCTTPGVGVGIGVVFTLKFFM